MTQYAKLTMLAATLLLAACHSTVVPTASQVNLPAAFEQTRQAHGGQDVGHWWRQWHDPVLSRLIEEAVRQNYDVRIAQSRLAEARANAGAATADLGPMVGMKGSAGRLLDGKLDNPLSDQAKSVLRNLPGAGALADDRFDLSGTPLSLGLSASWEPDIFGRKQSDADAAASAALGAQAQLYGAQMLVAADVADNYVKARAAQARMQAAKRSVAALQRMAQYVNGRFKAGQVTAYETGEVASKLSAEQARVSTLDAEYAAYVRNIAVLSGQPPQSFRLPESGTDILAKLPDAPSGQTPQGLLERRPDLLVHAAQVNAYAAKLASAKADLLPRFSIDFLAEGIRIDGNTALQGWGSPLSVGIQVPIFTNGRIQANIRAADARLQTALLQYDQTLVKALGDVDNAYQAYRSLSRQNTLLAQSHRQAAKQADDSSKLFQYGEKTLDTALTARVSEIRLQESLIQARLARAQSLLALYKALGGGWTAE